MSGRLLTWFIVAEVVALSAAGAWACRNWAGFSTRSDSPDRPGAGVKHGASAEIPPKSRGLLKGAPGVEADFRPRKKMPAPPAPPLLPLLKNPRIVVEKSALRLKLYDGEKLIRTYRVVVGAKRGDKVRQGDMRTPEGKFYICIRKAAPATPFVRSLGLSYPNVEDANRGLRAGWINREQHRAIARAIARRSRPPWDTPLGGAIMIHGCRKGRDSTLGCVALDNADIRELYTRLPLGTPVTILP